MKTLLKSIKNPLLAIALLSVFVLLPLAKVQAAATVVTLTTDIGLNPNDDYNPYMYADSSGNVYVGNTGRTVDIIEKFNAEGDLLLSFGIEGSGNGEFINPRGITTDSSGNIFVVDRDNNRVQKFNSSGVYITQWGTGGSGNGEFAAGGLGGIAADSLGNVYVVDSYNDRIQKFDNDGVFIATWGTQGAGNDQFFFWAPGDIEIDSSDNVYISDTGNDRIKRHTTSGVYVSSFGTTGTGNGQFDVPSGISVSPSGNIYVADYNNHRIQEFDNSGTFLQAWGSEGLNPGEFTNPIEVLYGPTNDLVYVMDDWDRLQFFDLGNYVTPTPTPTATPTPTPTPTATPTATPSPTGVAPTVTTGASSNIDETTATVTGTVSSDGGSAITERGIVYSSSNTTPTISDNKQTTTGTTGAMTVNLTGLTRVVTYHARAYATNAHGTSYGSVVTFKTLEPLTLRRVYFTFGKLRYNKYASPATLRTGDTAYLKNYNTSQLKLLQVFLYDYAKKGNQGYTKSKVTTNSMYLRTNYNLATGKRYAYVMKFQDKATGIIATKYFVVYTTKSWLGNSTL